MLQFGLRLGTQPRQLVTTTPRPTPLLKRLITDPRTRVTRASTHANKDYLAPTFFDSVVGRYADTRLGRQELDGELLDDMPGALWQRGIIEAARVPIAQQLVRVVVAIDPAAASSEHADETGIVVVGRDAHGHGYVLADVSGRYTPAEWARAAIVAYQSHKADRIVAEINNGGDMVEATLRILDPALPYRAVRASRGKVARAEPVAALYEQGRIHHVGAFPQLEDQMCGFTADFDAKAAGYSPDRVDALVWGFTDLLIDTPAGAGIFEAYRRLAAEENDTP
jgi:predicted phage terminase large subunit-like protein